MISKKNISIFLWGVLFLIIGLFGCAELEKMYGQPIHDYTVTQVSEILSKPSEFDGKVVIV